MHAIRGRALTLAVYETMRRLGQCTAADIGRVVPTDAVSISAALKRLEEKQHAERRGKTHKGQVLWSINGENPMSPADQSKD